MVKLFQPNGETVRKTEADPVDVDAKQDPERDVTDSTESDEEESHDIHSITKDDTEETSKHSVTEDPTENELSIEEHDIVIDKTISENLQIGSRTEEIETKENYDETKLNKAQEEEGGEEEKEIETGEDYDEIKLNKAEVDVTDTDTESNDYNNEIDSSTVDIDAESNDCGNKTGIKKFKIGICMKDNVCDIFDFLFENSIKSRMTNITNEKITETNQEDVFFGKTEVHLDKDLTVLNSTKSRQPQNLEKKWILYSRGRVWVQYLSFAVGHHRMPYRRWPTQFCSIYIYSVYVYILFISKRVWGHYGELISVKIQ